MPEGIPGENGTGQKRQQQGKCSGEGSGEGSGGREGTGDGEGGEGGGGAKGGGFNGSGGNMNEEGREEATFEDINNLKLVSFC